MLPCPTCQQPISPRATACPRCGEPLSKPRRFSRRHVVTFLTGLVFLVGLALIGLSSYRVTHAAPPEAYYKHYVGPATLNALSGHYVSTEELRAEKRLDAAYHQQFEEAQAALHAQFDSENRALQDAGFLCLLPLLLWIGIQVLLRPKSARTTPPKTPPPTPPVKITTTRRP